MVGEKVGPTVGLAVGASVEMTTPLVGTIAPIEVTVGASVVVVGTAVPGIEGAIVDTPLGVLVRLGVGDRVSTASVGPSVGTAGGDVKEVSGGVEGPVVTSVGPLAGPTVGLSTGASLSLDLVGVGPPVGADVPVVVLVGFLDMLVGPDVAGPTIGLFVGDAVKLVGGFERVPVGEFVEAVGLPVVMVGPVVGEPPAGPSVGGLVGKFAANVGPTVGLRVGSSVVGPKVVDVSTGEDAGVLEGKPSDAARTGADVGGSVLTVGD